MVERSRREFLTLSGGVVAGIVATELALPVGRNLNRWVTENTDYTGGNSGITHEIEEQCESAGDPQACRENFDFTPDQKFKTVVLYPPAEEVVFRVFPSKLVSMQEGKNAEVVDEELWFGTRNLRINRREFLMGLITSLSFGLSHNVVEDGIDTRHLPVHQTLAGGVYWILQRKLGVLSNIAAHSWNNFKGVNSK